MTKEQDTFLLHRLAVRNKHWTEDSHFRDIVSDMQYPRNVGKYLTTGTALQIRRLDDIANYSSPSPKSISKIYKGRVIIRPLVPLY